MTQFAARPESFSIARAFEAARRGRNGGAHDDRTWAMSCRARCRHARACGRIVFLLFSAQKKSGHFMARYDIVIVGGAIVGSSIA